MNLDGKVCVVTGATSGLGLSFSRALTGRGSTVYGLARRTEVLQNMERELGDRFHGVECDVTSEYDVSTAFNQVLDAESRIDVLINNAGLGRFGKLEEMSAADWDVQMRTNLRGVFLCTRAAVPTMKGQNAESGFGGHIVNISSVAGLVGNPLVSVYNATKFGLRGFSEALMKEFRDDGIRVTCLYPGSVETAFFDKAGAEISANPLRAEDVTSTVLHVLEAPDNCLISEVAIRPLRPRG